MGDAATFRLWGFRALYLAAVMALLFALLLPVRVEAGRLPGPDAILALTIAWALRQPEHLPIVLVAGAMLVVDLLLMRPPGLMAALAVVAVEVVRAREAQWRDLPLPLEWLIAASLIVGVLALNALLLAVFFVPQPALGLTLIRLILTAAAYPVAALVVRYVFCVPRRAGDNELGSRT
jgi:rod shape-determining protein MreD